MYTQVCTLILLHTNTMTTEVLTYLKCKQTGNICGCFLVCFSTTWTLKCPMRGQCQQRPSAHLPLTVLIVLCFWCEHDPRLWHMNDLKTAVIHLNWFLVVTEMNKCVHMCQCVCLGTSVCSSLNRWQKQNNKLFHSFCSNEHGHWNTLM